MRYNLAKVIKCIHVLHFAIDVANSVTLLVFYDLDLQDCSYSHIETQWLHLLVCMHTIFCSIYAAK